MLGKYQVLKHLATGGMAEIFLARTTGLEGFERYVVVKCIKPEFATNAQFVQMFLDEARISAQLHHNHIAQVFDIGIEDGVLYFAMEYIHGQNVQAILQAVSVLNRDLPYEHAITIAIGAAHGLDYAHDKLGPDGTPLDLVHRDVTPTNIIVSYDGAVKVVDFGIVKAATRATQTRSGVMKGKLAYMSPEQCRSEELDRRSDVFALGILLYELTTTEPLFQTDSDYATMDKIVRAPIPSPKRFRADYPDELAAIVMKCLERDREARYQTAGEIVEDLLSFAQRAMLTPTNAGLARFMRELFGKATEPWVGLEMPPLRPAITPAIAPAIGSIAGSGEVIVPAPTVVTSPSTVMPTPRSKLPIVIAATAVLGIGIGAMVLIGRDGDRSIAPPTPTSQPVTTMPVSPVTPDAPPPTPPIPTATTPTTTIEPAVATKKPLPPLRARDRDRKKKPPPPEAGSGSPTKLRDATILKPPD